MRGLRNNNPGNLRHGSDWIGLSATQKDDEFCQFAHSVFGIRAMARLLLNTYQRKMHLFTVPEIISRYAPDSENNTEAYIDSVCHQTGFTRHQALNLKREDVMSTLLRAMITHENGSCPYTWELDFGIALADRNPINLK